MHPTPTPSRSIAGRVRLFCALLMATLGLAGSAQAQLTLRLPIDFSVFEQGDSFQTTPFPVANNDFCDVTGDQPVGPFPVQCGEVDTPFAFQVGQTYNASVSATSLSSGSFSFSWSPFVACVRTTSGGEVISGGSSSFCTQSITSSGQGIFWDLGGLVTIPATAPAGRYTAQVTLTVSGPGLTSSLAVAVELDVQAAPVSCNVSSGSSDVDFGQALAMQSGTVSLWPTSGARTYSGGQFDPSGSSPFSLSTAQVTTNATNVVASVSAPASLGRSGGGGSISYLSWLAYRDTSAGSYILGVTGSGSVTRAAGGDGFVGFRLGGRVTTTSTSAAGTYLGTVSVTYSCN